MCAEYKWDWMWEGDSETFTKKMSSKWEFSAGKYNFNTNCELLNLKKV